jgi:hypothetical protein
MLIKANNQMFLAEAAAAASALPYLDRADTECTEALAGSCAR